jgi:prepilin-type N-terminal cleavage/methylation domain-containing protein
MAKRAFTMVELLFVVALTSLVLGATVGLYGFTMTRLAQGAARFSTEDQARKILDEIEAVVRDSSSVTLVSSGGQTGLAPTGKRERKRRRARLQDRRSGGRNAPSLG